MSSDVEQPPAVPSTFEIHPTIVRTLAGKAVSVPSEGVSTQMAIRASGHSLLSLLDQIEGHYADALESWGGDIKDFPISPKAIRDFTAAKVEVLNALQGGDAKPKPGSGSKTNALLIVQRGARKLTKVTEAKEV
jgi:hypothetical protein